MRGKSRPLGVPARLWFDRPTRWRNVAMLRGEPTWHTSSTGPMSMPSSSDAVATRARRSPARRRLSTRYRRSFDRLPWCAATAPSPRRSPSWCASRSARRRVLTNTIVVWCSLTRSAMRSITSAICSADVTASSSPSGSSSATSRSRWWPASTTAGRSAVADEQSGDRLDRALRGRQSRRVGAVCRRAPRVARA